MADCTDSAPLPDSPSEAVREVARRWLVRRDLGFTPKDQAEFERWYRSSPMHAWAFEHAAAAWKLFDRLPAKAVKPLPALRRHRVVWAVAGMLAAAASISLLLFVVPRQPDSRSSAAQQAVVAPRLVRLSDGTTVMLNTG